MSIIDPINHNTTIYNETTTPTVEQGSGVDFTNILNEALNSQLMQAAAGATGSLSGLGGLNGLNTLGGLGGMNGLGGMSSLGGLGGMSGLGGPGAMFGAQMPSATAGMENAIIASAEAGEMSGEHLLLFMLIMMMQSSDAGSEFAPIMQMMAQMLSQSQPREGAAAQNNMLGRLDTNPGIRKMVDTALSQVGYRERNKDGSVGNGNFTQFGAWYGMDGQPWCAMFVSWSADQAGILNNVVPKHASTNMGVAAYREKGLYAEHGSGYTPREGDAIYFTNSAGRIGHVGIVVAYDPRTQRIYTVEGNTDNAVRIRHYDMDNPRIHGFGRNGGTSFGRIPKTSTTGNGANIV